MVPKMSIAALLLVVACSGDNILSPSNLDISASSSVIAALPYQRTATPGIETIVTLRNNTSQPIPVRFGDGCFDGLRIFKTADLSGTPVYSNDGPRVCAAIGILPSALAPGETRQATLYVAMKDVLGSSLPNGTYYVDARVTMFIPQLVSGMVDVDAGSVNLAR